MPAKCVAFAFALLVFATTFPHDLRAADASLHARIDALIAAGAKGELGPPTNDAMFARRVYLDLVGRIPSRNEAEAFVNDKSPDKRTKLIDSLLASSEHPARMADLFNQMLMERRGENPEWRKFLETSFAANKPWDQMAREMIDPSADNETLRGAAYFYTRRLEKVGQQETDYPGLTRDVGRMFLGMDLQCAQCHNHLFIDSYKQPDFQGLFIVYQNTAIRADVKFPAISENPLAKKIEFMSVFDKVPMTIGPRVPGGKEIDIPTFEKGQEYLTPPDKRTRFPGVLKFSALKSLATELPTPSNRAFVENIVNRLWFVMMGRGLVNPLDQHHVGNPPSHPELLALLSKEFVEHKFDIRWMLHELALTQTYQRSSEVPATGDAPPPESYRISNEKRMSAEQMMASALVATGPRDQVAIGTAPPAAAEAKPDEQSEEGGKKKEPVGPEKIRQAFVKAFSNPPQEPEIDFAPSLKSALFVLNDAVILDSLVPQAGNLAERLSKLEDAALVEEVYLSVLTRQPTDDERTAAVDYLSKNKTQRANAITNLAWSLLACTEFCLNH